MLADVWRPRFSRRRFRAWRVVEIAAILCVTVGANAPTEAGWLAYEAGQYEDAVNIWKRAAAKGKPVAEYGLGLAYDLGRGVAPDPIAACTWYSRAGEAGHAIAAFNAGLIRDAGRCGPRNAAEAALWYGRAAAAGVARAQFNLGQLYSSGDGVPRNVELASSWYRLAADNGIEAAASRVAKPQPPIQPGNAPLLPVKASSPEGADSVVAGNGTVPLVWTAPEEPEEVRFYVEVVQLPHTRSGDVISRYVDVSALLVQLPQTTGRFAWRVFTVGVDTQRYVVSTWHDFTIAVLEPS